jgi:mRNA interferase RelE/StbE
VAWQVEFSGGAARELRRLPPHIRARISVRIDALARNPLPPGSKKLVGQTSGYRIRIGDYRVLYELQKHRLVVFVVKVGHRRDVYRGLAQP